MTPINLRTFSERPYATRLGDIVYLPEQAPQHRFIGANEVLLKRLDQLPRDLAEQIRLAPYEPLMRSAVEIAAHTDAWDTDETPAWFAKLPDPYRREAERMHGIHSVENANIVLGYQYARLGGFVVDLDPDTLIGGAYARFRLHRLGQIRQLAWLTQPLLPQDMKDMYPMRYEHNRLSHVWDVAAVANLLGHGLGLSETDVRTLTLAAATHDARTPAGGDTTKQLDRAFFDEDAHYGELLGADGMADFLAAFGIEPARLTATVQGEGLLGTLLDLADKTAYLCRDAGAFHYRFWNDIADNPEGDAIHELLLQRRDVCAVWRSAEVRDGQLVLRDPEGLAEMLRLRSLLFRALYFHPGARFTEFIVSHLVLRHLVATGEVTREQLLAWNDNELDRYILRYTHQSFGIAWGEPVYEGFDNAASAETRRDELRGQGERCVMIEQLAPKINPGTHFLVRGTGRRTARPLREAYPELAAPAEALARVIEPFRLYWVPWNTLPERLRKVIEKC